MIQIQTIMIHQKTQGGPVILKFNHGQPRTTFGIIGANRELQ